MITRKSNQVKQDSKGNQKRTVQGQRPDMENRQTQERTQNNENKTYKGTKVNEYLGFQ